MHPSDARLDPDRCASLDFGLSPSRYAGAPSLHPERRRVLLGHLLADTHPSERPPGCWPCTRSDQDPGGRPMDARPLGGRPAARGGGRCAGVVPRHGGLRRDGTQEGRCDPHPGRRPRDTRSLGGHPAARGGARVAGLVLRHNDSARTAVYCCVRLRVISTPPITQAIQFHKLSVRCSVTSCGRLFTSRVYIVTSGRESTGGMCRRRTAVIPQKAVKPRTRELTSSTSILSNPTGPSEDLTMLAIAVAAVTFCVRTS